MKQLFRSKYMEIHLVKGLLLGVGYDGDHFIIMIGCIAFEFQTYMFKRRRNKWEGTRTGKPSNI